MSWKQTLIRNGNLPKLLILACLPSLFFLSCDSGNDAELGTCRLYNNWNDETYEVRTNVTLDECQEAASALPSNNTYWSAYDWNEN